MSAHRSVRRRHARRLVYHITNKWGEKIGKGNEVYINLLQGIPYLEECGRSGLQPWYWDKTEETYTKLQ